MIPKFRAWDELSKKMFQVNFIDFIKKYVFLTVDENWITKKGINNVVLMQSTGLKERNGVEIFEGDIVRAWSEGVHGNFQIKRRVDGLWLLYPAWRDRIFWYMRPTDDGQESCEIVGNIYENPELLEVEDEMA